MMYLNRHPEHDPFYAFDLANTLSLWICVLKGKCWYKKNKIHTTSRNTQSLNLDLSEQAAVRNKTLFPSLLSSCGLFQLLRSFWLGPSRSFSESCVISFDILGLGLRRWSHGEIQQPSFHARSLPEITAVHWIKHFSIFLCIWTT